MLDLSPIAIPALLSPVIGILVFSFFLKNPNFLQTILYAFFALLTLTLASGLVSWIYDPCGYGIVSRALFFTYALLILSIFFLALLIILSSFYLWIKFRKDQIKAGGAKKNVLTGLLILLILIVIVFIFVLISVVLSSLGVGGGYLCIPPLERA